MDLRHGESHVRGKERTECLAVAAGRKIGRQRFGSGPAGAVAGRVARYAMVNGKGGALLEELVPVAV